MADTNVVDITINNITLQDITIEPMTREQLLKTIQDRTEDAIQEDIAVDWKQLQTEAKKFLSAILKIEEEETLGRRSSIKKSALFSADKPIANLLQQRHISLLKLLNQERFKLISDFQQKLDNFRGIYDQRKILYIEEDKITGKLETYEIPFSFFLKGLSPYPDTHADTKSKVSFSDSLLKDLKKQQSFEKQGLFTDAAIERGDAAWQGTKARLERCYAKQNKTGKSKKNGYLMWMDENGEWVGGTVNNYGDVKEAYFHFLVSSSQKEQEIDIGSPDYYSHKLISNFYLNYITKVSSLAAIYEEDVVDNINNVQYAIKSSSFSTAGIGQYKKVAMWIISQKNALTKDEVSDSLKNSMYGTAGETFRNKFVEDVSIATSNLLFQKFEEMRKANLI